MEIDYAADVVQVVPLLSYFDLHVLTGGENNVEVTCFDRAVVAVVAAVVGLFAAVVAVVDDETVAITPFDENTAGLMNHKEAATLRRWGKRR